MASEPDDPKNNDRRDKDPWRDDNNEQPLPDLDAMLRHLSTKFGRLFGTPGPQGTSSEKGGDFFIVGVVAFIFLVIWVLSGIFIVQPAEQGVILRFGRYVQTVGSGPHWIPRLIESVDVINIEKISNYTYDAEMLTKDENIVYVKVAVQYRIVNSQDYLFNIVKPVESLKLATASALRQVIGDTDLNDILTVGRTKVTSEVKQQLTTVLDRYRAGFIVTDVALQSAKAPDAVREAFDDAIKAREDQQRYINQANAYSEAVLARAHGESKQIFSKAAAYRQKVVLTAKGDVARFIALLPQYRIAPNTMRERMYLGTVEQLLLNNTKIIVDNKKGNNVLLLPSNQFGTSSNLSTPALIDASMLTADTQTTVSNRVDTTASTTTSDRPYRPPERPGRPEPEPQQNGGFSYETN